VFASGLTTSPACSCRPVQSQAKNLALLLELQTEIVEKYLRAGATCRDVYEQAQKFVAAKNSSLAQRLVKNIGFATGIEFRDGSYTLSAKNSRAIRKDMAFNLSLGFDGIDDPNNEGKTYSLLLIDTVRVSDGPASYLTDRLKSATDCIFYKDDDDEEEDAGKKASPKKKAEPANVTAGGKVLRNKSRKDAMDATTANKIREHQRDLAQQKQEDGLARFADADGADGGQAGKTFKKFESYKRIVDFPSKTQDLRVSDAMRAVRHFS
jgi:Xaa-Pro aminopeptidase